MKSLRRALVVLYVLLAQASITTIANAEASPSLHERFTLYSNEWLPTIDAHEDLLRSQQDLERTETVLRLAETAVQEAQVVLERDRRRFSDIAVGAYMGRGGRRANTTDDAQLGLTLLSTRLRTDERNLRTASEARDSARRALEEATDDEVRARLGVAAAEDRLLKMEVSLGVQVADELPTLPGFAYHAYISAIAQVREEQPDCNIVPSLLVGLGRIASNHGRANGTTVSPSGKTATPLRGIAGTSVSDTEGGILDGTPDEDIRVGPLQVLPTHWEEHSDQQDSVTNSPEWLRQSSIVAARFLCATQLDLQTDLGLTGAVQRLTGNASIARAVVGSARHASRATALNLGPIPPDPRQEAARGLLLGDPSLDANSAPIDALLLWSRARIGTPYSQCLGLDVRPEDPECPPGTNRFGAGFFDCSGFVSAAYASIGIGIPTTTDAMSLSHEFDTYFVRTDFDPSDDRAGDILLMDGHVALSTGDGVVLHASGGQLTEEPIPVWVRNGLLGVYRILT